ncbi:MAG: ABC transporter ATP-binding protein [Betaproteobacteria bacterium]|nr:ABC transporter ATP-binding protein [Betaproteobacteria bacterium]
MAAGVAEVLIQTMGLVKEYVIGEQTVVALRGISVSIEMGEFVAVMGPSGSGKSTFMNLIGCLDRPTRGDYMLAGEKISALSGDALAAIRNKSIGFVFQQFNLLPRTSALDNVELPLLYGGVPAAERHVRAKQRLAEVGLADRMDHHPAQLSGGQQQRVAIARALINNPVLILADEPTGALDSRTSLEVMALLQQLNRDGMSVVMVTHEQDIAAFARRNIHFRDGLVVEDHPVQKINDAEAMLCRARAPATVA